MAKNRVSYQTQAAYIGPSIVSGSQDGFKDPYSLERVQSITYSFNVDRADIAHIGKVGLATRPITEHPTVDFEMKYVLASFKNEELFGFNFNLQSGSGAAPTQTDNFEHSLIRDFSSTGNRSLDRKNIYVVVMEDEGIDAHQDRTLGWDSNHKADVIGISNCYLSRYSSNATVGGIIENSVSYQGCDINYFKSVDLGTEQIDMPIINFKDLLGSGTLPVSIEPYTATGQVSALMAHDVMVSIEQISEGDDNLGVSLTDLKVQNYNVDLTIDRERLRGMGFRIPIDFPVREPATATISIDALMSDAEIGRLAEIRTDDNEYNINLDIHHVDLCAPYEDGGFQRRLKNRYMLRRAHLERASYSASIGNDKTVVLGFMVDFDPDDISRGLFLSGYVNI